MTEQQALPTLEEFLAERVAPRFAEQVQGLEKRIAELQAQLSDVRAAQGTIAWCIRGDTDTMRYANFANGQMQIATAPTHPPLMTIVQTAEQWERFVRGLPAPFVSDPRRPLGKSRVERLKNILGSVRFVLTGLEGGDWSCLVAFGNTPLEGEPRVTIKVPMATLTEMQQGKLDPQAAFLQGRIQIAGDMGFAMQLGMVLFL